MKSYTYYYTKVKVNVYNTEAQEGNTYTGDIYFAFRHDDEFFKNGDF